MKLHGIKNQNEIILINATLETKKDIQLLDQLTHIILNSNQTAEYSNITYWQDYNIHVQKIKLNIQSIFIIEENQQTTSLKIILSNNKTTLHL